MSYRSTKHYGHDSHCRLLHGYALAFTFVFEADCLDHRNWVIDFGALDELKNELKMLFDHKTVIAANDPDRLYFEQMEKLGLCRLTVLDNVGCEAFAKYAWGIANKQINHLDQDGRVRVVSCEVREHGANSALYIHDQQTFGVA
jgi:6-pyruvoyltetrahydropterin/6-carboxytetrahydropterin synthase